MGTSSVTLTVSTKISPILCYICTYETFVVASANWQIGKDQKYKDKCRCPQPSQAKRNGPKSTKSQAKCQKTASPPPPPPGSPIHAESSPSSPEVQTQQALSPPKPQELPQPEGTLADVLERTADLVGPIISSVVSSIQTSNAPPQGEVLFIKSSSMDLFFQLIIIINILSADIVPSVTPADQPVVPLASASQRREIALKQVSHLTSILHITNIWSSNDLSPFSFLGARLSRQPLFLRHRNF